LKNDLLPVGRILGEMMAHELGHVLLNLASHSHTGIMKGLWDLGDLWNAEYGSLLFTKEEAASLRTEAVRRNASAAMEAASPEWVSQSETTR